MLRQPILTFVLAVLIFLEAVLILRVEAKVNNLESRINFVTASLAKTNNLLIPTAQWVVDHQ